MANQPADTTVVVVLTSTSIVTPSYPADGSPTASVTEAPGNNNISDQGTVTTVLITSEQTVIVTPTPTTSPPFTSSSSAQESATTSSGPGSLSGQSSKLRHSTDLSTGAKIAIGVAIPCGVLLLLALAGFFFWRRRKHAKTIREKRLAEIHDYSYNPNIDENDGAGNASIAGGGLGNDRQTGSNERPDSMATLHGAAAIGNTKSSSDDNPTMGNYRGWGPAPESSAPATVAPVPTTMATTPTMNASAGTSTAPSMAPLYSSATNPTNYPYDTSSRSPENSNPLSPTRSSPYTYYDQNNASTGPQAQQPQPQHQQPPTAVTSDQIINPALGYNDMPSSLDPAGSPPHQSQQAPPNSNLNISSNANAAPQRVYEPQQSNSVPYQVHQPQYSSLFSPTPEESRRVASNF